MTLNDLKKKEGNRLVNCRLVELAELVELFRNSFVARRAADGLLITSLELGGELCAYTLRHIQLPCNRNS